MKYRRRSLLYLPGSNRRFIEKGIDLPCDALILDLEDSVSPAEKALARENVVETLKKYRGVELNKELIVRINSFSSPLAYLDLAAIVPWCPDTIIVPKADTKSILAADMYLSAHSETMDHPIHLIGLIETAQSLMEMQATAQSSTYLKGFQFGSEDYTKDMEVYRREDNQEVLFAKSQFAIICRAYGLDAIDTPYTDIQNMEQLAEEIAQSKRMGFTGKTAIHPNQIDTINTCFAPSQAEIDYAKRVVEAFAGENATGKGSISLDGKMIDAPIYDRAVGILSKI